MADVDGGMFAAAGSSPAEVAASEAVGQQLSAEADIASAAQVRFTQVVSPDPIT